MTAAWPSGYNGENPTASVRAAVRRGAAGPWDGLRAELWPAHLAALRDLMSGQLLSRQSHKSAVAQYVRRSADAWRHHWAQADAEFLARLTAFPLLSPPDADVPKIAATRETELLLAQQPPPSG